MAQSSFHALKGPLARALGNLAKGGHGDALVPLWTEAVGPVLAARSRPVRLEAGVLTVEADRDFTFDLRRAEP
ncbi:MAG: DciA family protein, partial [Myxococcales bacterium]